MEKPAHAEGRAEPISTARFGPFELDLRRGELRKEGRKIRLQEQPFQILRMLIESAGEVVSREDIRERLWLDDTVVEFEHSINAAVKRLRDALRESADKPRYIKTIARRGYCFIGELEVIERPAPMAEAVAAATVKQPIRPLAAANPPVLSEDVRQPRIFAGPFVLLLLVAALGVWLYRIEFRPSEKALQPLMRLDLDLPSDGFPSPERGADAILSPDGMRLVYVSQSRLFTRMLDQSDATELPGTEGAKSPFFSPDGKWVAFFAGDALKKVPIQGGPATIIQPSFADGGSWDNSGIVFGGLNFVLSRIPPQGGAPTAVTKLAPGEVVHRWPQILPGGKAVLFSAYRSLTGLEGANIEVISLRDGRQKTVVRGGTWGRYLPGGYLVYIDNGSLLAVRFDLERLEVSGTPTPVLEGVGYSSVWGSAQIDFSRNGALVYRAGKTGAGLVTVRWLDASGNDRPLLTIPGNYLSPTISPDGRRLALISSGDIWVYDLQHSAMVRLTFGGGCGNPLWTADGRYVVFRASNGIFWTRADATAQPRPLLPSSNSLVPWSFTADGKRLAYVEVAAATGADIWTAAVDSSAGMLSAGKPELFRQTRFDERSPMISPDGRWLAYVSNESGKYQVYVEDFPNKRIRKQVSTDGAYPAWSRNGHELFFWRSGTTHQLMVAAYSVRGDSFLADPPRVWSQDGITGFSTTRSYDPAPDGKRIVALMPADTPAPSQHHLIFLLNFFDELRRRLPMDAK
jgi:Tol biopolymer transport system component/DNA-binding winged helix-turn-helix (wHTH) protein